MGQYDTSNSTSPGTIESLAKLEATPKGKRDRWIDEIEFAEKELKKVPFFVRGKARRNTETFAAERGLATITVETLYDAKAHFAR